MDDPASVYDIRDGRAAVPVLRIRIVIRIFDAVAVGIHQHRIHHGIHTRRTLIHQSIRIIATVPVFGHHVPNTVCTLIPTHHTIRTAVHTPVHGVPVVICAAGISVVVDTLLLQSLDLLLQQL